MSVPPSPSEPSSPFLERREGLVVFGRPNDALKDTSEPGWNLVFSRPARIIRAYETSSVGPLLDEVQKAVDAEAWAVFMLAYEAAPGLDPHLKVKTPENFPLAWAGIYAGPSDHERLPPGGDWRLGDWTALVRKNAYREALAAIHALLKAGETYQVNYAMPLEAPFTGDALGLYLAMAGRMAGIQGHGLPAYLHLGDQHVACFSPELFFHRQGDEITVRPMKGTAARGRFPAEDDERRAGLAASPKERAENVMIVDLLRNDLGRVAAAGSVKTPNLFTIETYPTVLQMTSTVTARLRPGTGLRVLIEALFPCGSVTGAPKVGTMSIIAGLEAAPRQVYCGAIGYMSPHGRSTACVPIRTLLLDRKKRRARFWVGSGITIDSLADAEYSECLTKMRFLNEERPRFRLLESLLLEDDAYYLLRGHLARLRSSAAYFGFACKETNVLGELESAANGHPTGRFKVRLLMDAQGRLEVQTAPLNRSWRRSVRLGLALNAVRSDDPFLFHKTTNREVYDRATALFHDADDVLLTNERGEITETCRANLVYRLGNRLYTPPLDCGLLDGVLRRRLLDKGKLTQRILPLEELRSCRKLWLINSVRKWVPVSMVMQDYRSLK